MNLGASLVKQVASATNDVAGDGTTTATVLARAILVEGCKSVAAGMNAMDLRRGINMAVDTVIQHLKSRAKMISTTEEVAQVGAISANNEREIGDLIAKAMERVGREGVITVVDGKTLENELEVGRVPCPCRVGPIGQRSSRTHTHPPADRGGHEVRPGIHLSLLCDGPEVDEVRAGEPVRADL